MWYDIPETGDQPEELPNMTAKNESVRPAWVAPSSFSVPPYKLNLSPATPNIAMATMNGSTHATLLRLLATHERVISTVHTLRSNE